MSEAAFLFKLFSALVDIEGPLLSEVRGDIMIRLDLLGFGVCWNDEYDIWFLCLSEQAKEGGYLSGSKCKA